MTYGAFGLVEVLGEANAVLVLDRMLKTAEVFYETQDTKCGGIEQHNVQLCVDERQERAEGGDQLIQRHGSV